MQEITDRLSNLVGRDRGGPIHELVGMFEKAQAVLNGRLCGIKFLCVCKMVFLRVRADVSASSNGVKQIGKVEINQIGFFSLEIF